MAEIKLSIPESGKLRCLVELVNIFFHLTKSEMDILVAFMNIDRNVACTKEARKAVAEQLQITIPVINNHVKALKDKKAIIKGEKRYAYHPVLMLPIHETEVKFVISIPDESRNTQSISESV